MGSGCVNEPLLHGAQFCSLNSIRTSWPCSLVTVKPNWYFVHNPQSQSLSKFCPCSLLLCTDPHLRGTCPPPASLAPSQIPPHSEATFICGLCLRAQIVQREGFYTAPHSLVLCDPELPAINQVQSSKSMNGYSSRWRI